MVTKTLQALLGVCLGLVLLEAALRANPQLMLHGMAILAPIDPPVTTVEYDVRSSDADVFFWMGESIRPIPSAADRVEAHVRFTTDEFGFPNPAPAPTVADVVVLGRSYSLGAQASTPWPRILEKKAQLRVLNLAQAASGIDEKASFLFRYGLPRHPRWVIVEILPSMDILGYASPQPWLVQRLPSPLFQFSVRKMMQLGGSVATEPVYPISVETRSHAYDLTFFPYYLEALSVDETSLQASTQWTTFRSKLETLIAAARAQRACPLLLFAPTNAEVFAPLALDPRQLQAATVGLVRWQLNPSRALVQAGGDAPTVAELQANADASRRLLTKFAQEEGAFLIDPTDAMRQAVLAGEDPFMRYDTHWSELGHEIVAEAVLQTLREQACQ